MQRLGVPDERSIKFAGECLRSGPLMASWMDRPMLSVGEVWSAAFDGSKELRRHLRRILQPLFELFLKRLGLQERQSHNRTFDLS